MKFEQSASEKNESRKRLLKVIFTWLERTSKSLPSRSVGKYTQCQSSLKFPPPYFENKIQDTLAPTLPCFFCGFQTVNLLQAEDHQVLLFWEMLKLKDIIASGHSENRKWGILMVPAGILRQSTFSTVWSSLTSVHRSIGARVPTQIQPPLLRSLLALQKALNSVPQLCLLICLPV